MMHTLTHPAEADWHVPITDSQATRDQRGDRGVDPKPPTFPTHDEIAAQAFAIHLSRGCQDGYALQDWLDAEAVLSRRRLPLDRPSGLDDGGSLPT